jgi:hypothetical protein
MDVMFGATAVGGGDLTVVVLSDVEFVVLLVVESVTIGSAANTLPTNNITVIIGITLLLNIYF